MFSVRAERKPQLDNKLMTVGGQQPTHEWSDQCAGEQTQREEKGRDPRRMGYSIIGKQQQPGGAQPDEYNHADRADP